MSIYDVVEIARWKEDNMSCIVCKHYMGIGDLCENGHMVNNGSESFDCTEYEYNGECEL